MLFTTIVQAPGLASTQRRQVAQVGPPEVLVRTSYPSLLESAGFVEVIAVDVTRAYRSTLAGWFYETERRADEVVAVVGVDEYKDRQRRRAAALAAVDAGMLERWRYLARRRGG